MTEACKKKDGKVVLWYFLAFFGTITAIDGAFVYIAIHTNSGVVMEQAYEKGLAYNETLSKAKMQPQLNERSVFENGIFRWTITDKAGKPVTGAEAKALFFRPVKDGSDFETVMAEKAPGVYEIKPEFPVQGLWTAQLDAKWDNNKRYQTSRDFIAK